jgi:putative DNA primase/helicase
MSLELSDLREHIRVRHAGLAGFIEQGASLSLDGDLLRVIPRNDIYIRYLNDNRASIAELASELYGRKLRVEILVHSQQGDSRENSHPGTAAVRTKTEEAGSSGPTPEAATDNEQDDAAHKNGDNDHREANTAREDDQSDSKSPARVSFAIGYARHGCAVFPVHWICPDGLCSCGGSDCKSPGKHPLNKGWQAEATADESQIRRWWKRYPLANIGIACGKASNLTVLDVDGQVGADTLRGLELEHGELPAGTPVVLTGSGGRHYYFVHQPSLHNAVRFGPGLDIRTDGGLVVGAGSANGNGPYVWDAGATIGNGCERTQMPAWMVALIAKTSTSDPKGGGFRASNHPINEGEGRNNYLYKLGRSLKAQGLPANVIRTAMDAANREQCTPPLKQSEFKALVEKVLNQADRPGFGTHSESSFDPSKHDWPSPQQLPGQSCRIYGGWSLGLLAL